MKLKTLLMNQEFPIHCDIYEEEVWTDMIFCMKNIGLI